MRGQHRNMRDQLPGLDPLDFETEQLWREHEQGHDEGAAQPPAPAPPAAAAPRPANNNARLQRNPPPASRRLHHPKFAAKPPIAPAAPEKLLPGRHTAARVGVRRRSPGWEIQQAAQYVANAAGLKAPPPAKACQPPANDPVACPKLRLTLHAEVAL